MSNANRMNVNLPTADWTTAKEYEDITYKKSSGVARIAFNRHEVRNAFRPGQWANYLTLFSTRGKTRPSASFSFLRKVHRPRTASIPFCSGGDQRVRGETGYMDEAGQGRLNILEVQRLIRFMPKVVMPWCRGGPSAAGTVCT